MKLLITVSDPVWGGKHAYMWHLAEALTDAGHEVILCGEADGLFVARAQGSRVRTVASFVDQGAGAVERFAAAVMDERVDVIVSSGRRDYLFIHDVLARCARDIALVLVRLSGFALGAAHDYGAALARADLIILLCAQQLESQFGDMVARGLVRRDAFTVVRTTVDTERFAPAQPASAILTELGLRPGQRVISSIARLSWEKGHIFLLEAFAAVAGDHPDLVLMFIGDGPEREPLERRAQQLGVSDRLIITGHRDDVPALLSVCWAHVLASICEETGAIALQEAMAMAVPVLASRRGIIPDYVHDRDTGLLFESGNATAIAAAMRRLLGDPELHRRLAERGRQEIIERFDQRQQTRHMQSLFADFVARRFPALVHAC
jgi:glycosyltransferase involved in cell wall biosynthesis